MVDRRTEDVQDEDEWASEEKYERESTIRASARREEKFKNKRLIRIVGPQLIVKQRSLF